MHTYSAMTMAAQRQADDQRRASQRRRTPRTQTPRLTTLFRRLKGLSPVSSREANPGVGWATGGSPTDSKIRLGDS
jgi:hypothetical protein